MDSTTIVGTYTERDTASIMRDHPHLLIIHTYQYNELPTPEAQAKARKWWWDHVNKFQTTTSHAAFYIQMMEYRFTKDGACSVTL